MLTIRPKSWTPKLWTAALTAALITASLTPADAGFRRDRGYNGNGEGYVIANSRFGNGSVRGAVREGRNGLQVQLPGGTWEYCRASCSETLRVETVDIFANQGEMKGYGTASQECGIFGCLDVSARFRD
jgi:hypothetical protein